MAWILLAEAIALAALALISHHGRTPQPGDWLIAAVIIAAGVTHGFLAQRPTERRRAPAPRTTAAKRVDLTSVFVLPAAVLLPAAPLALVVVVLYAHRYRALHRAPCRFAFSTATVLLSALSAHIIMAALALPALEAEYHRSLRTALGLITAATTYFVVLTILIGVARGLSTHRWALSSTFGTRDDTILTARTLTLAVIVAAAASTKPWIILPAVAITVQAARLLQLRHAAEHDSKTGLLNVRGFQPLAEGALALDHAAGHPTGVLMLDLDRFRAWNDRLGHAGADDLLLGVVAAITRNIRRGDLLCRWGGEELLILCPHTTPGEVHALAERVRTAIEQLDLVLARPNGGAVGRLRHDLPACTVSIGMAMAPDDGNDLATLQDAADRALHVAKTAGRNRSVMYASPAHHNRAP